MGENIFKGPAFSKEFCHNDNNKTDLTTEYACRKNYRIYKGGMCMPVDDILGHMGSLTKTGVMTGVQKLKRSIKSLLAKITMKRY